MLNIHFSQKSVGMKKISFLSRNYPNDPQRGPKWAQCSTVPRFCHPWEKMIVLRLIYLQNSISLVTLISADGLQGRNRRNIFLVTLCSVRIAKCSNKVPDHLLKIDNTNESAFCRKNTWPVLRWYWYEPKR